MPSLGEQIKQAREARGLTIQQIAEATHIGGRFLQAIESDTYDILPGGVFNRAFVRKFASQVGFDQEQAVRLYDEQLAEMGGEPAKTSYLGLGDELEAKSSSGNGLLLAFIAVIVLGAILYAAYLAFSPARAHSEANPVAASTPTPTVTPVAAEAPSASPSPEASASPTPSPGSDSAMAALPDGLRVQLIANGGDCWVNFQTDSGKTENVTLKQGENRDFTANDKLKFIRLGNLPALNILINGKRANPDKIAPNRKGLVVDNVVITKDNYQQFLD